MVSRMHLAAAAACLLTCLTALLTETGSPVLAQAPMPVTATRRVVKQVAAGVELIQEVIPALSPEGPLVVNVLRVDPKVKGVRVEAALGQDRVWGSDPTFGREIVSTLAARRGAVAGVNAGFFPFMGNPIGIHLENGDLITEPNNRTAFTLMADGTARFDVFTFAGSVRVYTARVSSSSPPGGPLFFLTGLNRKPGKRDTLLLYTPRFFSTTLKDAARHEVVLTGIRGPITPGKDYTGTVTRAGAGGLTPLAADTIVLSGGGAGAEWLRTHAAPGRQVSFSLNATPAASSQPMNWETVRASVAGGSRLLSAGRVTITAAEEGFGAAFATTRHPRTAVATTRNGRLLLMTVDGRQKSLSRGVSLPELAALLLKYEAWDAMNLDGGGSTAMAAAGDGIVNSPSSGSERPVANALLVFADVPKSTPRPPLTLGAAPGPLVVGERQAMTLTDASGASLAGHPRTVWSTTGGIGFVGQDGVFVALRPGAGTVRAALGAERVSVPVTVRASPSAQMLPAPVVPVPANPQVPANP